jgi:hypothetical protein
MAHHQFQQLQHKVPLRAAKADSERRRPLHERVEQQQFIQFHYSKSQT